MTGREQHSLPPGVYLANAPAPVAGDPRSSEVGSLAELEAEVLETRLKATLRELSALADDVADRHRRDEDPAPVETMEAICWEPGARLVFASLARRVEAGTITWQQVWSEPRDYDGGLELLSEVLRRQNEALRSG